MVVDLRKIDKAKNNDDHKIAALILFSAWIAGKRQDWNGEIMSLRSSDIPTIGLMSYQSEEEVMTFLVDQGLLIEGPARP